jgi:hypothetical protein
MTMNFVHLSGVIESTPETISLPNFEGVGARLSINRTSRNFQVVNLIATGETAAELRNYRMGDGALLRGHLTVAAKTGKLQVFVDSLEPDEALPAPASATHRMNIQIGGRR